MGATDQVSDTSWRCESCGSTREPAVYAVRRIYVTPPDWDTEGREDVQPDVELWCAACLTSYPNELVVDADPDDDMGD
jgi:hypothetical protein